MGGIVIVIICIINLILISNNDLFVLKKELSLILIPFIGYALVGLFDDLLILINKNNKGLKPNIKFILELFIGTYFYTVYLGLGNLNLFNFFGINIDCSFIYGAIIVILFSGFTNATNFTDGLDGLLSLTSLGSFSGIGIYSYLINNYTVFVFSFIMVGAILSFLVFNLPKASIFMGDTGSLAIGGAMLGCLIVLRSEYLILFFGFIYIVELFSVMLQVWYFKRTKGSRILKMAPFHHHLELVGLNDNLINILFTLLNLLFVIIGIILGVSINA